MTSDAVVARRLSEGLLGLAFHPGFATNRKLYVELHEPAPASRSSASTASRRPTRTSSTSTSARASWQVPAVRQPQRRDAGVREGRLPLHRARRRRQRRRSGQPGPELDHAARQDPADRHQRQRPRATSTASRIEPVRRQDRPRRDLAARAPQPVAVLVRSRNRQPVDRRRRPGPTTRRSTARSGPSTGPGSGVNWGWRVMEGMPLLPAHRPAATRPARRPADGVLPCLERPLRGDRRLRLPRLGDPGARRRYVFGDYCSGEIWVISATPSALPPIALLLSTGFPISSFGEDKAGELFVVDYGGTIYRITAA